MDEPQFKRGDWHRPEIQQALLEQIADSRLKMERARFAVGMIEGLNFPDLTPLKWAQIRDHLDGLAFVTDLADKSLQASAQMLDRPDVYEVVSNYAYDDAFGKDAE